jgi:hypothetical protein
MTHALRIVSAGIAIAAVAVISLSHDAPLPMRGGFDPIHTVPPASQVFQAADGRAEGNSQDMTY